MSKKPISKQMPILPFIQERLSVVEKEIKADLFQWLSGKKHPNLAFDGTLVLLYWGNYLEENISKIIQIAFTANRELAIEHDLDPVNSINDATKASKEVISEILNIMADYDQRMRGKGYPNNVTKKDITEIKERYLKTVEDRASNEKTLFNMPKKNTVKLPLTSEHGLYWFIRNCHWSVYLFLLGLALSVFLLGLGAGRNKTFLRVYDALTSANSTREISQPIKPPANPAIKTQNTVSTKHETIKNKKP